LPDSPVQRIALCGGTFDPFHRGHLDAPLSIAPLLGWTQLIYIPAWRQPFKLDRSTSSSFHRYAMTVLATIDRDEVSVSLFELEREEVSYTVDTLEAIRVQHPEAMLDWVIGDDNLEALPKWRRLDRILELANFIVLDRHEGNVLPDTLTRFVTPFAQRGLAGSICMVDNPTVPISSTEIRERVARGDAIDGLVDPRVARYIRKHRLYAGVSN
jgi:nicotinate-nucleotide adenylyltransferase